MVHDKKRSGDPDYDDKVPMDQQVGQTVKGPNGEDVLVTESNGPVGPDGSHADLTGAAEREDNRPRPGGVAREESTVQVYDGEDVKQATKAAGKADDATSTTSTTGGDRDARKGKAGA